MKLLFNVIFNYTETQTNLQTVLEAVQGSLVAAISVLLSSFAEEQSSLIQEEMSLHRLEAGQLLHACWTFLMADPHTEGSLHQHTAQLTNVSLQPTERSYCVRL